MTNLINYKLHKVSRYLKIITKGYLHYGTHFHKKPNLYTSHVQLKVSNLERSIEFYTTIIGFQLLEQTATTVYLTVDGKTSFVSLVEVQDAVSQQGLRDFTISHYYCQHVRT